MIKTLLNSIYDSTFYNRGELYFDQNKIELKPTSNTNCAIGVIVEPEAIYEAHLQNINSKSINCSCNCTYFIKEQKVCDHIIGTYLKYLSTQKKSSSTTNTSLPKSLNVHNLLETVTLDELSGFVKYYAGKDRKFLTALKIHFAKNVTLVDNADKYKNILDTIIKPITLKNQRLMAADWNMFNHLCKDLVDQASDLLALGRPNDAFDIINTVITKLAYVATNFPKFVPKLAPVDKEYHDMLAKLIVGSKTDKILSLRAETFVKHLVKLSYYKAMSSSTNAYALAMSNGFVDQSELLSTIKSNIKSSSTELELIVLYGMLFTIKNEKEDAYELISQNHLPLIEKIVDELVRIGARKSALALLDVYRQKGFRSILNVKKASILLIENPVKNLKEVAALLLSCKDLRILDEIVTNHKDIKDHFVVEVEKSKDFKNFTESITYPYYLQKTFKYDELITYLTITPTFELLKQFDKYLIEHRPTMLSLLYVSAVGDYLDNHMGEASNEFITNLSYHLNSIGAQNVVKQIKNLIAEKYHHRVGLELI